MNFLRLARSQNCVQWLVINQGDRLGEHKSKLHSSRPGCSRFVLHSPLQSAVVTCRGILDVQLLLTLYDGEALVVLRRTLLGEKVLESGKDRLDLIGHALPQVLLRAVMGHAYKYVDVL